MPVAGLGSFCYLCGMNPARTIAFHTLGCKLNFSETSAIGRQLTEAGYRKTLLNDGADVLLLNTCSVTENADRECRSVINRALRVNPDTIVVVTGCFAQLKPEEIANIPGVDLVLGANEKFNAANYIDTIFSKQKAQVKSCEVSEVNSFHASHSTDDRTRIFLKVQDGCDYSCTFCTIPLARGKSRSNSIDNVLREITEVVEAGAKEIVLTGVNLGDFGLDPVSGIRNADFFTLAGKIEKINNPVRIRISSIEPNLLEERIISLVSESEKFVPHFHIPLQSGSDNILKKMRRRYLSSLYSGRVKTIKQLMPHCAVGVDVITGFPGETEEDFILTYEFLRDLDISYLHVFTYSERNNTPAADYENVVPLSVRKDRTRMLRILSDKKLHQFYLSQINNIRPVLFESENKAGMIHGYTDNYIRVAVPYDPALVNQVVNCRLTSVNESGEMTAEMEGIPDEYVTSS